MSTEGEIVYQNEGFRNSIGTVREDGKRKWIYPRKPKGKYYNWRTYLSYLLLAILFAGPFIKIDGQPLLLLNLFENKFVIFGADRKSTRLNSSHVRISYAVFCLKKKK